MTNNARIARNTLMLYIRMAVSMLIGLYTSRVVLQVLGVEDFGIYSAIGGVVGLFGFLNSAMATSTQRYLTFALGKQDEVRLRATFSASVCIHGLIALLILVLAETIGLWLLLDKMTYPESRANAALWVYQTAIATALLAIITVPYHADIIAHERMSAFALISILEVLLKLGVVFLLPLFRVDRLWLYGLLLLGVQLIVTLSYRLYSRFHFAEARMGSVDRSLMREMLSFAGWNLWGNLSAVLSAQGVNILLNVYFGPIVNAARGLAVQAQCAVQQLALNFQMALNPQITKSYAADDLEDMHVLVFRSSKFTFFLLYAMVLPLVLETPYVLTLWLHEVPEWTVTFLRLLLVVAIIDSVANPLMVSAAATGKIRLYQSVVGGILLLTLPLAYVALRMGYTPNSVFVAQIGVSVLAFLVRLFIIRPMIDLSLRRYWREAMWPCVKVGALASAIGVGVYLWNGWHPLVVICAVGMAVVLVSVGFGLNKAERSALVRIMKNVYTQKIHMMN